MCRDQVGAGYEIKTPRTTVPKLLPLMEVGPLDSGRCQEGSSNDSRVYVQVGLKGMMLVNGISKLGRFFGLPLPTVLYTPPLYSKRCRYDSRMSRQS